MRVSHFTMLFELEDKQWLLFNSFYGVWDIINPKVAAIFKNQSFHELTNEQLSYAVNRNYLTSSSLKDELNNAIITGTKLRKKEKEVVSIVFALTVGCNLACTYCFQTKLRSENIDKLMTNKQVDAVFRLLDKTAKKKSIRFGNICLFGGEPLMQETMKIASYILEQAKKRGISVSAITNGVELHLFKDHLGRLGLSCLGITIDGPANIHDQLRRRVDGSGTFEAIIENVELALRSNVFINLRVNIDNYTLTGLSNLIDYFNNRGWLNNQNFRICIGFIERIGQDADIYEAVRMRATEILYGINKKYGRMVVSIFEGTVGHRMNAIVFRQAWGRVPVNCSPQLNNYIFAPDGNIYACWRMIGESINKIGTYEPDFILDNQTLNQWFERSSINMTKCKNCVHMFCCGGGCARLAIKNSILEKAYCKSFEAMLKSELRSQFIGRKANDNPLS